MRPPVTVSLAVVPVIVSATMVNAEDIGVTVGVTVVVAVVAVVVVVVVAVVVVESDPQAASDRAISDTPPARAAFAFFFSQTAANFFCYRWLFVGSVHFGLKCTCRNHVHIFCSIHNLRHNCTWFFATLEKTKTALQGKLKVT
jgi:hypothetical protein